MRAYKIRDANGAVIGQYQRQTDPEKLDDWGGDWNVGKADELNDEPAQWWNE